MSYLCWRVGHLWTFGKVGTRVLADLGGLKKRRQLFTAVFGTQAGCVDDTEEVKRITHHLEDGSHGEHLAWTQGCGFHQV